jgi:inorganic triphosphatase YgiF
MTAHTEIELKLEVAAAELRRLEHSSLLRGTQSKRQQLVSVYFDTDNLKLRRRGLSLRVRRANGAHIQTIKRNGSGNGTALSRDEWEAEISGDAPNLGAARGTALEAL